MSAGEHEPIDVDPLRQPVHPREMLAGFFDDAIDPEEYTICTRDVANYTAWITADLSDTVCLEGMQ